MGELLAAHLSDSLVVSYHSGDFDEAEQARQNLAVVGALCAVLRRTAGAAQDHLADIDSELPGCSPRLTSIRCAPSACQAI
jgi:hypothetical protein